MLDFYQWLEYLTVGHSEDWSDREAANRRFNDEQYAARGVKSKYIAQMKSEKQRKRNKKSKYK